MAQYSHLSIFNGTPYDFVRGDHHSYQMDDWDSAFPDFIKAGSKARIQIGFQNPFFGSKSDDGAEQVYILNGASSSFQILARAPGGEFQLLLNPVNLSNDGHAHAPVNMGWREDSELYIWVAGRNDGYLVRSWWLGEEA